MRSGCAGLALFLPGCAAEAPAPVDAGPRMPPPEWAIGTWVIVRAVQPGVGALGVEEAARWRGRRLVLSDSAAKGPDALCDRPSYREMLVASDSVLAEFKLAAGTLPLREGSTTQLAVQCRGIAWVAFGARALATMPDTVLVPWDGTFFVLGRLAASDSP